MNINEQLKELYKEWKESSITDIDGLVISDSSWTNELTFYPKGKQAWKCNSSGVETTVTGIEWNISKNGALKPVILITPTQIDGSIISRVTGIHAKWIEENGIGIDSIIKIIKSGAVIPKVIDIIKKVVVILPNICPCCNNPLYIESVDLLCKNINCKDKKIMEIESFLLKSGVEGVSSISLTNWSITTFENLITFKSDNSKSQDKFISELKKNIFTKSKEELFSNLSFSNAGSTNINKILDFYGEGDLENTTRKVFVERSYAGFPEGIGERVLSKIETDWKKNLEFLKLIISDSRYNPKAKIVKVSTGNLSGKTFLLTGTMTEGRKIIEQMIVDNGGTIASSVSKSLSHLVVGADTGSKLDKAKKLDIDIITEDQLRNMI